MSVIDHILGPRLEPDLVRRHALRFGLPGFFLLAARVLLLVSLFLPYWQLELHAPQYPDNLYLIAYVNHLEGDVAEIDTLNHYIGMRPLEEAARIERAFGVYILIGFVILLELASYIHTRWAVLLVLPALTFPGVFLLDLYLWMRHFGLNLDPEAPLSTAIDPFVPPVLGKGVVGQFETVAMPGPGLWLSIAASGVLILALYFHRRAYLPLLRRQKEQRQKEQGS